MRHAIFPHRGAMTAATAAALIVCLVLFAASSAVAGIRRTNGQLVELDVSPGVSLKPGAVESDTEAIVFLECYDACLGTSLAVDIDTPDTYTDATLSPGVIPAGTSINSYVIHADPVTGGGGTKVSFSGSVRFEERILGVIVLTATLDASDGLCTHGIVYPTSEEPLRGLEMNTGTHLVEVGNNSIEIDVPVGSAVEQIRVITKAMDHFTVYTMAEQPPVSFSVETRGQFDRQLIPGELTTWSYFANPVGKNDCGINRPNAHFMWYALEQEETARPGNRELEIENQFGETSITVGAPRYLMVPAEKTSDEDSNFPGRLDHYKCYEVLDGDAPAVPVDLADQWSTAEGLVVGEPLYFCVPVRKVVDGEGMRPRDRTDHFFVYSVPGGGFPEQGPLFRSQDQFSGDDEWRNRAAARVMLCVPTLKNEVTYLGD